MTTLKKSTWRVITAFLVGTLLGSGAFWEYKRSELNHITKIIEIRHQLDDVHLKISDLSRKLLTALEEFKKHGSTKARYDNIRRLKSRLGTLKDDFQAIEKILSKLEGREPRSVSLDFFRLEPATGVTITIK